VVNVITENGNVKLDNESRLVTEQGSIRNVYLIKKQKDLDMDLELADVQFDAVIDNMLNIVKVN